MYKIARTGAVLATGLLTALALTGCGSDGDKGDSGKDSAATTTPSAGGDSASPSEADGGDSAGGAKALEGAWAGQTDGKPVVLSVASGKAVVVADSHVCSGTVSDLGKPTLELKCADGDTARTMGAVESNDGKTVVISWDAGARDKLGKADADALKNLPDLADLPTP